MEVTNSFPARNVAEFIAYCKAKPRENQLWLLGKRDLGAFVG